MQRVHMYCCNCADALIHHTICKHIHLVAITSSTDRPKAYHSEDSYNTNMDEVFGALQRDYQGDLLHQRQKIMKHLSALTTRRTL